MKVYSEWLKEGLKFEAVNERGVKTMFDAPVEGEAGAGPTPMEAYLQALITCSAVDVVNILRKRRLKIERLRVEAEAEKADKPPKIYTRIDIKFIISGEGIDEKEMERALGLSMDKFCSIKAMIDKTKTEISVSYEIL